MCLWGNERKQYANSEIPGFCEGGTFSAHGFTSSGAKLTSFMSYNVVNVA